MPEAACTSTQLHTQVSPDNFAAYWNASQAIAGVQLALGANSPYLLGKELWQETRIPLFEQATDTRSEELKAQGVRPRVWFGERWITSIFDLFEENVRYFPALLPITDDEDPLDGARARRHPDAAELRLHNGTIYRWNRPVYDVVDGAPAPAGREPRAAGRPDGRRHDGQRRLLLRAGPGAGRATSGRCGRRCRSPRPRRTSTSAARARHRGAGLLAGHRRRSPATELVLRRLLPLARAGPRARGASTRTRATGCSASSSSAASSAATAPPGTPTGSHARAGDGDDRAEALR